MLLVVAKCKDPWLENIVGAELGGLTDWQPGQPEPLGLVIGDLVSFVGNW